MWLRAVAILQVLILLPNISFAQTAIPPYEIVADGSEYQITLSPKEKGISEISVYFVSTGNISTATEMRVAGPMGIRGTVRGGFLGTENAATVVTAAAPLAPIRIRSSNVKDAADFPLVASTDNSQFGTAYNWYHLQKDNCAGSAKDRYLSIMKLDLTGVNPTLFDSSFQITLSLKEFKFKGAMVASIKPSSDGKYKGEPILLMGQVGSPEYVNIVSWKNKKIAGQRRIPVVKYVGYKGYSLSLARLNGVLNGGRSTVELSNGGDIYGVCFTMVRRRQSVNGYPAPN